MNASAEPLPAASRYGSPAAASAAVSGRGRSTVPASAAPEIPVSEISVCEGVVEIPGPLALHHGGKLEGVRIAWRLAGATAAPVVCALGGISAGRQVCLCEDPREAWWPQVAGPGRPLDSNRHRILSFDYLGGSGQTTGPEPGSRFPSLSSYDQAELLLHVLDHLGLRSVRAIVGGSYGAMVALAFGERYPERVGHLVTIGAADRPHPMATAWRSVQREVVRFALSCGRSREGLQLARALAMATYRSPEEFSARFAGSPARDEHRFVFPIESYLFSRGRDFAARHRPESFLCLSESIDLHRVDASRIFVPTTVVAVREDQLVPLAEIRAMVARLPVAVLHEISSLYGHDAFLKETEQLRRIFNVALGSLS